MFKAGIRTTLVLWGYGIRLLAGEPTKVGIAHRSKLL